jgi:radical SAM protein with 4Fe4S-binding SPASM domain
MLKRALKKINRRLSPGKLYFGPEHIVLGVNNTCNLRCKMCDVGNQNLDSNFARNLVGTHPLNMPENLIFRIIDQTAKHFPNAKLAYAFTEPLIYPHLASSLLYAKEKNLYTTITTNALKLKSTAQHLLAAELDELFVSLDGPQEIHNEIRGHKKSFQNATEGIEVLKADPNCPKITIICAITEWNTGELVHLIDSLKHLGIDEFAFMHTQFNSVKSARMHNASHWGVHYPSSESNLDFIDFSNMDLDLLLKEIHEIKNTDYPFKTYFSPEITKMDDLKQYYLEPERLIGSRCGAVYNSLMVKSDGSVIPAHGRCYNLTIGDIYKEDLNTIWKSAKLKQLRIDLHKAGGLFQGCGRCCSAV